MSQQGFVEELCCVLAVTLSEMQNPVYYVAITMVVVEVCIGAMYKLTHH